MAAIVISATEWVSGNLTVPSDCTAVYLFWAANYSAQYSVTAASLGGNSANSYSLSGGQNGYIRLGLIVWYNPPTGSQTLSITFNAVPNTTIYGIAFVKDGNTTAYRDADAIGAYDGQSVTIDTNTTDLVIKGALIYNDVAPAAGTGWTSVLAIDAEDMGCRISTANSPGASSTTANSEVVTNYAGVVAVSVIAGEGASATALPRRALNGPFYGSLRGSVR